MSLFGHHKTCSCDPSSKPIIVQSKKRKALSFKRLNNLPPHLNEKAGDGLQEQVLQWSQLCRLWRYRRNYQSGLVGLGGGETLLWVLYKAKALILFFNIIEKRKILQCNPWKL